MTQLSYSRGAQDKPLMAKTIPAALEDTVRLYGDQEALVVKHQDIRYTYTEFSAKVNECAKALMALGVKKGDRVGIWSPNNAQWCITQFATAKMGAILVNLNPAYREAELEYALKQSGCSWLITADKFKTSDYHQILHELVPELAKATPGQLQSEKLPDLVGVITLCAENEPGMLTWDNMLRGASQTNDEQLNERSKTLQFDDPINIQYTSGTTGFPKGATLSHYNILNNGFMVGESIGLTEKDRMVIPVPLYHCFGMVMGNLGCITHGSTMIYPDSVFNPEVTLNTVAEEKATVLYGVPTMFIAMLESPLLKEVPLETLRTGIMAGSTCPIEVMKRVITDLHMEEVQIAYGMTETSPVSTQTGPDDSLDHRTTTVGRTQPHLETKIINDEGMIVERGEVGQLCTRGYSVMLGYWNNPEETEKSIDSARWMKTGDLAIMDEDGYVKIVGRNSDMIIRGGENIYPREIEEFLYQHPDVSEVQVIGIPSEQFGEEVVAWVQLHPNATATEDDLRAYCKNKVAHFKVPKNILLVDDFPMTISGKVQKFKMRDETLRILGINAEK